VYLGINITAAIISVEPLRRLRFRSTMPDIHVSFNSEIRSH
jgi:hypothetical protein